MPGCPPDQATTESAATELGESLIGTLADEITETTAGSLISDAEGILEDIELSLNELEMAKAIDRIYKILLRGFNSCDATNRLGANDVAEEVMEQFLSEGGGDYRYFFQQALAEVILEFYNEYRDGGEREKAAREAIKQLRRHIKQRIKALKCGATSQLSASPEAVVLADADAQVRRVAVQPTDASYELLSADLEGARKADPPLTAEDLYAPSLIFVGSPFYEDMLAELATPETCDLESLSLLPVLEDDGGEVCPERREATRVSAMSFGSL